ncbi:DUF5131 family protein [Corallococcus sp. RDP092CA]
MADNSRSEWTDATWNPVRGCVELSPGCKHCYAEARAARRRGRWSPSGCARCASRVTRRAWPSS